MWKLYNYLLFAILRHSSTFEDKSFFGSGPHYHGNTHHKQGGDLFIRQIVVGVEDKRRSEARCVRAPVKLLFDTWKSSKITMNVCV